MEFHRVPNLFPFNCRHLYIPTFEVVQSHLNQVNVKYSQLKIAAFKNRQHIAALCFVLSFTTKHHIKVLYSQHPSKDEELSERNCNHGEIGK